MLILIFNAAFPRFNPCDKLSSPILQIDEVSFHYHPDKPIFKNICVNVDADSRICIVSAPTTICAPFVLKRQLRLEICKQFCPAVP